MARFGRSFPSRKNTGQSAPFGPVNGLGQFAFNGAASGSGNASASGAYFFQGSGAGINSSIPSLVQNVHGNSHGASVLTLAFQNAVSAGDFLFAGIGLPGNASVISVVDNLNNRWIQCGEATSASSGAEMWFSRGVPSGNASVTFTFSAAASVGINVSEWANVWWVDPLDQWGQSSNITSASPISQTVASRTANDLFISVISSSGPIASGPTGGYAPLTIDGSGYAEAYVVASVAGVSQTEWGVSGSLNSAIATACFIFGPGGLNPNLQFPEVLAEVSTTNNYLAPLSGNGTWTNISAYVLNMSLGPIGRQHELDRVQAAPASISVDNRDGSFNPWNTSSFLYGNGYGLKPMNPVKVTASWEGITSPQYYGYLQSGDPVIQDVLNVNATLQCIDIFQLFSLKYLSNNNYAQLVTADGGSSLKAYYRLGDAVGQYAVKDSSGNGNTGSLVPGLLGAPAFGSQGAFLYDPNTALDLTNGQNNSNGGFSTVDNTTLPPMVHNPLSSASVWTSEMWMKFTGSGLGASIGTQTLFSTNTLSGEMNLVLAQQLFSAAGASFTHTGSSQTWTVPPGVTSINVDLAGGSGGNSNKSGASAGGGLGGRVTTQLAVSSGEVLTIYVGGLGADNSANLGGAGGTNGTTAGGAGGEGGGSGLSVGGGGGGACTVLSVSGTPIAVAAGGGGAGGLFNGFIAIGGNAGGLTGTAGANSTGFTPPNGGGGGTQSGGGTGGTGNAGNGSAGSSLTGGAGGTDTNVSDAVGGGGGGGAGYFGGGGGGAGDGGAGGGGGSSLVPTGGTTTAGFQLGNGYLIISPNVTNPSTVSLALELGNTPLDAVLTTLIDGAWHYITTVVFSGSNSTIDIYVDGQLLVAWSAPYNFALPTNWLFGCQPGSSNGFIGILDEVALYSASISASQASNHYSTGQWFEFVEFGAADGAASVARMNKVITVAGLPASIIKVPYPFRTELYAEISDTTTTSALNYIQTTTETEPGLIFQGPDGYVYAYSRQYQYLNPTSVTSQGILADSPFV